MSFIRKINIPIILILILNLFALSSCRVAGMNRENAQSLSSEDPSTAAVVAADKISASKLAFSIQPTSATAGVSLNPALQILVQDSSGNHCFCSFRYCHIF